MIADLASSNLFWLISIPVVSTLVGWGTNWVAIRMLFHPRQPIRFLGVRFQGVLPLRREELARAIATAIESRLLSGSDLAQELAKESNITLLEDEITQEIGNYLETKIAAEPLARLFIRGPIKTALEKRLARRVRKLAPQILARLGKTLSSNLDIESMVYAKISELDMAELEELILSVSQRELRTIEYLGAVIGFLVGCIQVLIFLIFLS